MKVNELLESYHKPHAELNKGKTPEGEKVGKLQGSIKDWVAALNKHMKKPITSDDIAAVRGEIKSSKEYNKLVKMGFKDVTTPAAEKNGTFIMSDGKSKYNFLVHGKINNRTGYGGGIHSSTLPRIVPGDPHETLRKTMTRSMAQFARAHAKTHMNESNDDVLRAHAARIRAKKAGGSGDQSAIEALLKLVARKGFEALTDDELERTNLNGDESDAVLFREILKMRFDGVKNYKSTRVSDDGESGFEITFELNGDNYKITWYPEAGITSVSKQ